MSPNCHQWRAWQRRADTMHRNACALLGDMIAVLGVEDTATDYTDNVIVEAETLARVLGRCADAAKSPGRAGANVR